jgi:hypothetical protein
MLRGEGARHLCRFNAQGQSGLWILTVLSIATSKRRDRRAPSFIHPNSVNDLAISMDNEAAGATLSGRVS